MTSRPPNVRAWLMLRSPALTVAFLIAMLLTDGDVRVVCTFAMVAVGMFAVGVWVSVGVLRRLVSEALDYARRMEEINRKICERARRGYE